MSDQTYYAVLQYLGTHFLGWQRQSEGRTVQGEVEAALRQITRTAVPVIAAGRTDTGVHALGQVISFQAPNKWIASDLRRALNAVLPLDIWIQAVGKAPRGFNARRNASHRRYRYVIGTDEAARSPFRRPYEWDLCRSLDGGLLTASAERLRGEHDFRGLSARGQEKPHYRCVVLESRWEERPDLKGFIFHIRADRFLHHMVRFIVGLQVDVGRGRRQLEDIDRLLERGDNQEASPPAPARGLYLVEVEYPELGALNDR